MSILPSCSYVLEVYLFHSRVSTDSGMSKISRIFSATDPEKDEVDKI